MGQEKIRRGTVKRQGNEIDKIPGTTMHKSFRYHKL